MTHDLAVIGAGPAGLAAAVTAAEAGLDVVLLDAGRRPGGQYYRHHAAETGALHHGWAAFTALRDRLGQVTYLPLHRVWHVERAGTPDSRPGGASDPGRAGTGDAGYGFTVHAVAGDREERPVRVDARALVVAAGAYDRTLPFPGWDLPGVLTAGGAQALLKGDLVTAGARIVVAGTGPFLLPVAAGLAAAGATVAGVFEAARPYGFAARVAGHPGKAAEGSGYLAALARHRIPYRTGHAVIEAHAGPDGAVAAVTVARLDRDWRAVSSRLVECDAVAAGYGFTPQPEIPLQLGCDMRIDVDGSLVAAVDPAQRTSVPGVYAAGETTGVGGAQLALVEGELAGLAAAAAARPAAAYVRSGTPMPRERVRHLLARRRALRAFAAALHRAYPVRDGWIDRLRDDTVVCRCEEVTRGRLAEAVALGSGGANVPGPGAAARAAKLLGRAGMGRCQGRICGYAVTSLTAAMAGGRPGPEDLCGFARRPIAQPVRLRDLGTDPP